MRKCASIAVELPAVFQKIEKSVKIPKSTEMTLGSLAKFTIKE